MKTKTKTIADNLEMLWKEIIEARKDIFPASKTTEVLTEDEFKENPSKLKIMFKGEYNTVFCYPSLRQRAINGLLALKAYEADNNGLETDLSDMVSDLFHLAFQAGLDPDEIVRKAHVHFDDEIRGIEFSKLPPPKED